MGSEERPTPGVRRTVRRSVAVRDADDVPALSDLVAKAEEQRAEDDITDVKPVARPRARRSKSGISATAAPTIPKAEPVKVARPPEPVQDEQQADEPAPPPPPPEPDPDDDLPPLPPLELQITLADGSTGPLVPINKLTQCNAFAAAYLETLDAEEAAKAAGFTGNRAKLQGHASAMLRDPVVRTTIERQYRSIMAKTAATVERVWEEISYTAFLDPACLFSADGEPLPMCDIPEHARRALLGYEVKEGTIGEDGAFIERKLKFGGKDKAIDKLMRLHRMTDNDKMVLVNGDEFLSAMEEGRRRAAERK